MGDVERRLDRLEEGFNKMAANQTRTNVLLEQVMDWVKVERSNSSSIKVLQNNWLWVKGLIGALALPLLWLVLKAII